mgnify:CR=1 FL=1
MRSSIGLDVHKFKNGIPLIVGGINIDFDKGLEGHSDGDVLTHAIIDSLLGGSGMGDIGMHYPSSNKDLKNIDSLILLQETMHLIEQEGWVPTYLDATIIAQSPVLSPYVQKMKNKLSDYLNISSKTINIKATTTDGLGFIGDSQGMASIVVATMENRI